VLRQIGGLADGWMPHFHRLENTGRENAPQDEPRAIIERVHAYARAAGRDPAQIGLEGRLAHGSGRSEDWVRLVGAWAGLGASHLTFNTMGADVGGVDGHIAALRRFREAIPA